MVTDGSACPGRKVASECLRLWNPKHLLEAPFFLRQFLNQ